MKDRNEFNLSDFICDSICVNGNSSPTRPMFHHVSDPFNVWLKEDPLSLLGEVPFKTKEVPEYSVGTPIQEFFKGLNVLITGSSGFLGSVLMEKLVRDVPNIGHIYLLIRPKHGMTCEERFNILLEDKLFSRMKSEVPHYLTKLTGLAGDVSKPGLGLSDEDHQLIQENVHVIFHCAADVRFLKPLKEAIAANVLGSKQVLDLAKSTPGLQAFVHVSTAYSHCTSRIIGEKIPKISVNYKEVLDFIESNKDSSNEEDFIKIMQGWPNTYVFSKALCEDMLQEEAQGLPMCIIRPTVVLSTYKEPVRGWTNNVYGPLGLLLGVSLGVLHCFKVNEYHSVDAVPVDYVSNCMIAAAFKTGSSRDGEMITVYNVTSKLQNVLCWKQLFSITFSLDIWPSSYSVWYTSFWFLHNHILDKILHILLHRIPGAILDKVAVVVGMKPRFGKIFRTVETVKNPLTFFMERFWEFKDDNVTELWRSLSEEDQKVFDFDVRSIDWREYATVSWLGLRYYYLKESMDSIPAAKRKRKWLYSAHVALKLIFGFGILKLAVSLAHIIPI